MSGIITMYNSEFKEMKNHKLLVADVLQLRNAIATETNAGKRIDSFEKLLICAPAEITRAEVSRLTYSCQKAVDDNEYLGYMGEKIAYIRRNVLLAPEASLSIGKKIRLILTALFFLGILAVMELTPLGDYLFSEEGMAVLIIGGVVIFSIAGIFLLEGFYGFILGAAIGSVICSIIIKVAQIGYIPILILLAVMFLRKAFGSSAKMKKKHDEWIEETKVIEAIKEIRPYVEFMRERAREIHYGVIDQRILNYYDAALEKLNFYEGCI